MNVPGAGDLRRFYETVRWLRPVQVYGRAWHLLAQPRVDARPAPPMRRMNGVWALPARRQPSLIGPRRFRALGVEREVVDPQDWDDPSQSKLWRYNLHYFDDLNAAYAEERSDLHRAFVARWVSENPPGRGSGWEPYPLSLRIVNWIKWVLRGNVLAPACVESLAVQARALRKRLEWHLLGNHLFVNAKALVFAGLFFDDEEARGWLGKGLGILRDQLGEQVLDDGGQFELSPMYHALALEDVLDLVNVATAYAAAVPSVQVSSWRSCAQKMLRWAQVMSHPDGQIAFFNDAALGIAPSQAELLDYAERLGMSRGLPPAAVEWLESSGYVRAAIGPAVLLADVGRVGPDYLPGHAHADTLSFELSLDGRRWFVNSGCSQYGIGPERLRQRGTAAHNTVEVDGADSSEVWSGFRVARRARPFDVRVAQTGDEVTVSACHDGYLRLPGRVIHRRRWSLDSARLEIVDVISGSHESACGRLHLHPEVRVERNGSSLILRLGARRVRLVADGCTLAVRGSTWHPQFGAAENTSVVEARFTCPRSSVQLHFGGPDGAGR